MSILDEKLLDAGLTAQNLAAYERQVDSRRATLEDLQKNISQRAGGGVINGANQAPQIDVDALSKVITQLNQTAEQLRTNLHSYDVHGDNDDSVSSTSSGR